MKWALTEKCDMLGKFLSIPLKCQSQLQQTTNFVTSFQIFEKKQGMIFHEILRKYHAILVFLKKLQILKLSSAANYRWRIMG